MASLRKQLTSDDSTIGFPTKWLLRNKHRNSILMTHHYSDLGSASDWFNQISHLAQPIRRNTQIWVVMRHQYGISALFSQMSFGGETSGSVTKCWLFSQATFWLVQKEFNPFLSLLLCGHQALDTVSLALFLKIWWRKIQPKISVNWLWTSNAPPIAIFFFQNNIFPLKIMLIYDEPLWSGHLLVPGPGGGVLPYMG